MDFEILASASCQDLAGSGNVSTLCWRLCRYHSLTHAFVSRDVRLAIRSSLKLRSVSLTTWPLRDRQLRTSLRVLRSLSISCRPPKIGLIRQASQMSTPGCFALHFPQQPVGVVLPLRRRRSIDSVSPDAASP